MALLAQHRYRRWAIEKWVWQKGVDVSYFVNAHTALFLNGCKFKCNATCKILMRMNEKINAWIKLFLRVCWIDSSIRFSFSFVKPMIFLRSQGAVERLLSSMPLSSSSIAHMRWCYTYISFSDCVAITQTHTHTNSIHTIRRNLMAM